MLGTQTFCKFFICFLLTGVARILFHQKLAFGKVGFSKAMSNKWIRLDKGHEGGPRVFKTVCLSPSTDVMVEIKMTSCKC